MKEKLYCYLRVSTKSQEEDGHSIENQRHLGQKISEKLDMEFVEMNEGGLSSVSKTRPKFNEIKEGMRELSEINGEVLDSKLEQLDAEGKLIGLSEKGVKNMELLSVKTKDAISENRFYRSSARSLQT